MERKNLCFYFYFSFCFGGCWCLFFLPSFFKFGVNHWSKTHGSYTVHLVFLSHGWFVWLTLTHSIDQSILFGYIRFARNNFLHHGLFILGGEYTMDIIRAANDIPVCAFGSFWKHDVDWTKNRNTHQLSNQRFVLELYLLCRVTIFSLLTWKEESHIWMSFENVELFRSCINLLSVPNPSIKLKTVWSFLIFFLMVRTNSFKFKHWWIVKVKTDQH